MAYRVLEAITFGPGTRLSLNKAQAAARRHLLEDKGQGNYETTGPVQFKAGEEIGISGVLSKSLGGKLEQIAKSGARAERSAE